MISAGRQTDLQALSLSSSSSSTQLFARLSAPAGSEKDAVRYPLHEHQSGCSTGDNVEIRKLLSTRCMHTHFAKVLNKEVRTCKPIKWLTNLSVLAEALGQRTQDKFGINM